MPPEKPNSLEEYPVYLNDDLGLTYTPKMSTFKLWSPAVDAVKLRIYKDGLGGEAIQTVDMRYSEKGVWVAKIKEDLTDHYYTYQVKNGDKWLEEKADPYSTICGANGQRTMIYDWAATHPLEWEKDQRPALQQANDIVLYELHIRDFTHHESANTKHKGMYLSFTEKGTTTENGVKTGLAHLKELGVTHVHLLPTFDYQSIDETLPPSERPYNWGYDPHLYNVPEGTYSSNPSQGDVRVREFKEMVQSLHRAGIRVVMDVVYNHTGATETSVFNQLVPDYYYRQNAAGGFSNASACGNEIASERAMVRQFIVQSVKHWAAEYHIDGFRFDLMGIHDIETMNAVRAALNEIDPSIFIYGEGWLAGDSPLPEDQRATKNNVPKLNGVAAFSDEIRDAIKGHVFTHDAKGFISGLDNLKESIKFGVVGGVNHPQIDYQKVNYTNEPWAPQPSQCIVYASCHDNHTLWDRLQNSIPDASAAEKIKMQQLALSIVLTSQGVPFLHAGSEFCRTKQGVENSYNSPDSINQIIWDRKEQYQSTFDVVKNMVALRKAHPAFKMTTQKAIAENLIFIETNNSNVVGYQLNGQAAGDEWTNILIYHNGSNQSFKVDLPEGNWDIVVNGDQVRLDGSTKTVSGSVELPMIGTMILKR